MAEQGMGEITKRQKLLRAAKNGEMWRAIIAHARKVHDRKEITHPLVTIVVIASRTITLINKKDSYFNFQQDRVNQT